MKTTGLRGLVVLALLAWAGTGRGATVQWSAGGATSTWFAAGNWFPAKIPATNDSVEFTTNGTSTTIDINMGSAPGGTQQVGLVQLVGGVNRTLHNSSTSSNGIFQFNGAGSGVIISNGSSAANLHFRNSGTTNPVTMRMVLNTNGEVFVNSAVLVTVSNSVISEMGGARSLTKSGGGSLTLGATNLYSGGTVIVNGPNSQTAGAVNLLRYQALGGGAVTFSNAVSITPLYFGTGIGAGTFSNSIALSPAGSIMTRLTAASSTGTVVTLSGVISGGSATQELRFDSDTAAGQSRFRLGNAGNTFRANFINLWRGGLVVDSDGALGDTNNTLVLQTQTLNPFTGLIFGNAGITLAASRTMSVPSYTRIDSQSFTGTISGAITNTSFIDKVGAGALILNGLVSGSGGFTVENGGGTLVLNATNTFSGGSTNLGGTIALGADNALGTGLLDLRGTNSVTRSLDASARSLGNNLNIATDTTFGSPGTGNLTFNGATANNGVGAKRLTVSNAQTTINNVFNNAGVVSKAGTGLLVLGGVNTMSGPLTISEGPLALGASASVANVPVITISNGAVFDVSAVAGFSLSSVTNQILQGYGSVTGDVFTTDRSQILPGAAGVPGTLTVDGNVQLSAGYTNNFDLTNSLTVGAGVNDLLAVNGSFEPVLSSVRINVLAPLLTGSYRLVNYTGTMVSPFTEPVLGNTTRHAWSLDTSTTGQVNLLVAGTNLALRWSANTTADWDLGTTNWTVIADGSTDRYYDVDTVLFDDTGALSNLVNIATVVKPASVTVNSSSNYTFGGAGKISNGFGQVPVLTKDGSGTLTIATTNDFAGGTIVSNGSVLVAANGAMGTGPIALSSGTTLEGSAAGTLANAVSGGGQLVKSGSGTLTLTGTNTYAGTTIISNGSLVVSGTGYLGGGSYAANISNNGSLTMGGATQLLSGSISGTGSLTQAGANVLTLGGGTANTYGGLTTVAGPGGQLGLAKTGGVVAVPGDITLSSAGATRVIVFGTQDNQFGPGSVMTFLKPSTTEGRFELLGTTQTLAGVVDSTTSGFIQHREFAVPTQVDGTSTLILNGSGNYSYNGALRNQGGLMELIKSGSGTQTLAGANITYNLPTVVNGGLLKLSNTTAFASAITNSATVEFNSPAAYNLGNGVHLSGTGTWNKTGASTVTFNGLAPANLITASGQINVQQGILQNGNNAVNWSGNTANMDISAGATLNLLADPIFVNQLTGSGSVTNDWGNATGQSGLSSNTERFVIGVANGSSTFNGRITDTHINGVNAAKGLLELVKAGTGTITLAGINDFGGATIVSNGTLTLGATGAISNSPRVIVATAGATLDVSIFGNYGLANFQSLEGIGLVTGSVSTATGSKLIPGSTGVVGTLTFANDLNLVAGTTNYFNLSVSDTAVGGGINDLIDVGGLLEPSNAVIAVSTLAPSPAFINGSYRLFNYSGSKLSSFNPVVQGANPTRKTWAIDEATGGQVNFVVSGSFGSLKWNAQTSTNWDVNVGTNWLDIAGATNTTFIEADHVLFDDSGANTNNITLVGTLKPGSVTVNASSNYSISGSGKISGVTMLTKDGSGTLTLGGANDYSGGTVISNGTLNIVTAGALGSGTATIQSSGTLAIGTAGLTVGNVFAGTGTINANTLGTGTTSLSLTNDSGTFAGTLNIGPAVAGGGKVALSRPLAAGATINVLSNGTLFLSTGSNFASAVTLGGGDTGESIGQLRIEANSTVSGPVTLTGTITGANDGFVGHNAAGAYGFISGNIGESGGPRELSKVAAGTIVLTGTNTYSGGTRLVGGVLSVAEISDSGPSGIATSGQLIFNGGTLRYTGLSDATTARSVTNVGASTYDVSNIVTLALSGSISGPGALTKIGTGTLVFSGTNTYGGATTVNAGLLVVTNGGSIGSAGAINVGGAATGTLTIAGGSVTSSFNGNALYVGGAGSSPGVINVISGTLVLSGATGAFVIGDNSPAAYNQSGGVVTVANTAESLNGNNAGGASTINFMGGSFSHLNSAFRLGVRANTTMTVTNSSSVMLQHLMFSHASGSGSPVNTATLAGGTLGVTQISDQRPSGTTSIFNFNGGVLLARASSTAFMTGLDSANVLNGGAIIDTTNFTITIGQALLGAGNDGGLTKLGSGQLTLNAANTYTGATTVSAGYLFGTGSVTSAVTVNNGGAIGPGPFTQTTGTFTVASSLTVTNGGMISAHLRGTNPSIRVTGSFNVSPTSFVQVIATGAVTNGTYVLVDYDGAFNGNVSDLLLGAVPSGSQGYLTNNLSNTSLDLVVTNTGTGIKWNGLVDATWKDFGPLNWKSIPGGNAVAYNTLDVALFDDTAAANYSVNVAGPVSPSSVIVSNDSQAYSFSGSGGIIGFAPLLKYGTNALTLSTVNTYGGPTTVGAGTLTIGGSGQLGGGTYSATISNNGSLVYNSTLAQTFGGAMTGAGTLTQMGNGTLTLSGASITYTGATAVVGGLLKLSNATAFASSIANAGTVEFNSTAPNDGTPDWAYTKTLTGTGTVNKTGTGWFHIQSGTVAMSGQINVQGGIMSGNTGGSTWTGNTANLDVSAGAVFSPHGNAIVIGALTGSGLVDNRGSAICTLTLGAADASGTFTGSITNNANALSVTKTGLGTQTLSGVNGHTGPTTINAGTLALGAGAGLSSSPRIILSAGGTFDVSTIGNFGLVNFQSLEGSGLVTGSVSTVTGSKLVPGTAGVAGTLSFGNGLNLTAGSTNLFDLAGSTTIGSGVNDLIDVAGLLEPSNSVIVINPLAPLATGSYRLFNYTGTKATIFNTNVIGNASRKTWTLDETVPGQLNLTVGGGNYLSLKWNSQTSANWDTNVGTNWFDTVGLTNTTFIETDSVLFDDSGAMTNSITLVGTVKPGSVTVNSASNYSISGAGKISGFTSLAKDGTGTLTLFAATNDYSGGTTISNGTLQIGNGTINGTFGSGAYAISAPATLRMVSLTANANRPVWSNVTGSGTLSLSSIGVGTGAGDWGQAALPNGFAGTLRIESGRVQATNVVANQGLGNAAKVVILAGGQLGMWNAGTFTQSFTIAGTGYGEAGFDAAIRFADVGKVTTLNAPLELSANATIGAAATGTGIVAGVISGDGAARLSIGTSSLSGLMIFTNANTYSGGTTIQNASTLAVSTLADVSPSALGTNGMLTFNNGTLRYIGVDANTARSITNTGAANWDVTNATATLSLSGPMAGPGLITKVGSGTMVWSNNTTKITGGGLRVNRGTLIIANAIVTNSANVADYVAAGAGDSATMILRGTSVYYRINSLVLGETATSKGVLMIQDSASLVSQGGGYIFVGNAGTGVLHMTGGSISHNSANAFFIGNNLTGVGAMYQTGGSIYTSTEFDIAYQGGGAPYGFYLMTGGSLTNNSWIQAVRGGNGAGLLYQTGGSINVTNASAGFVLGNNSGGGNGAGVMYFTGGVAAGNRMAIGYTGSARGEATIAGSATVNIGATGVLLNQANTTFGVLNLNGGTLLAPKIYNNVAGGTNIVNFNGGLWQVTAGGTVMGNGANGAIGAVSAAYVYGGGAIIDSSNLNITVTQPLLAPGGNGVSSISLTGSVSGYVGAPYVQMTGGGGTGATAVALFDYVSGSVTGVVVTSPGVGYSSAPVVTFTFAGKAGDSNSAVATIGANSSGGLTKLGSGQLTLNAANTYTGATTVSAGYLFGTGSVTSAVTVSSGAAIGPSAANTVTGTFTIASSLTVSNGGIIAAHLRGTNPTLRVTGDFNIAPTTAVQFVSLGSVATGAHVLVDYDGTFNGNISDFALGVIPYGSLGYLTNNLLNTSIDLVVTTAGSGIKWDGLVDGTWKSLSPLNWRTVVDGSLTAYSSLDPVLFDDTATGTFTVNATEVVSPASIIVNNTTNSYAIGGSSISGTGSLTKSGSGLLTLSASNTYVGGTTINNGTLKLANASALGVAGRPITLNGGTLHLANDTVMNSYNATMVGSATVVLDRATSGAGLTNTFGTLTFNTSATTLGVYAGTNVTSGTAGLIFNSTWTAQDKTNTYDIGSGASLILSGTPPNQGNHISVIKAGAGRLVLSGNYSQWDVGSANIALNGGTLELRSIPGDSTDVRNVIATNGTTLALTQDSSFTFYSGVTMNGDMTVTPGRITTGVGVTHTLGTMLFNGTNFTLNINAGSSITSGTAGVTFNTTTLGGNSSINVANPTGSAVTVMTITGLVSQTGSGRTLTKTGSGTLTLRPPSPNNYTGGTVVNGGVLQLSFSSGGQNLGTIIGSLTINTGAIVRTTVEKGLGFSSLPTGGVQTITINGGLLEHTGLNGMNGGQTIFLNGGEIRSNNGNPSSTSACYRIGGGADPTIYVLASASTSLISGRVAMDTTGKFDVTNGAADVDLLVTATITDGIGAGSPPNGMIKTNDGTMVLNSANVYKGTTKVDGGTLLVNNGTGSGTGTNTVTVSAGGTLGGTGTVAGAVTQNGGSVSPGVSVGTLTVGGDYVVNGGSFDIQIAGTNTGSGYDTLVVSGQTILVSGTLNVTTNGYAPVTGDSFTILAASNGIFGTFGIGALPPLSPATLGWSVSYTNNAVILSVTSAPPPATGYDAWSNLYVLAQGPEGDDDGDGYANLLEYVTGANPTNNASTSPMSASRTNGNFALHFNRDTNSIDATLIVEGSYASTNDAPWLGIATNTAGSWGGATNVNESGSSPVNVTVFDNDPVATNRFLRLRVTRP